MHRERKLKAEGNSTKDGPAISPVRVAPWIWALLIPAVALAAAYAYWAAYALVYRIPIDLIAVQPSDGLAAFAALGLVVLAFNGLISLGTLIVPHMPWWVREPLTSNLTLLVYYALVALAIRANFVAIAGGVLWLLSMALSYLAPLWRQRDVRGYGNKLKAETSRVRDLPDDTDEVFGNSPLLLLVNRFPTVAAQFAVAVALIGLAYMAGLGSAYSRTSFLMTTSSPRQLLIGVVSDRAYLRTVEGASRGVLEVRPANSLPPMRSVEGIAPGQLREWGVADIP